MYSIISLSSVAEIYPQFNHVILALIWYVNPKLGFKIHWSLVVRTMSMSKELSLGSHAFMTTMTTTYINIHNHIPKHGSNDLGSTWRN
jgi:hypothetical protein